MKFDHEFNNNNNFRIRIKKEITYLLHNFNISVMGYGLFLNFYSTHTRYKKWESRLFLFLELSWCFELQ